MSALAPTVLDALTLAAALSYVATLALLGLGRMRPVPACLAVLLLTGGACSVAAWQATGPLVWALSGLSGVALWPAGL